MEYKQFGIYINDELITIITEINKNKAIGIDYMLEDYIKTNKPISNKHIIEWLDIEYECSEFQIFEVNLDNHPEIFKNYGYLGQISDLRMKRMLRKHIKKQIEDFGWE